MIFESSVIFFTTNTDSYLSVAEAALWLDRGDDMQGAQVNL